jgi:hypothetical protein
LSGDEKPSGRPVRKKERQGRYADAEQLLERSLAIDDKAFGSDHPNVAQSLSSFTEIKVATPMRCRWCRRRSRLRAPIRP